MKLTNYTPFHEDLKAHGIEYAVERTLSLGFDSVEFLGLSEAAADTENTARRLTSCGLFVACFSEAINFLSTKRTRAEHEAHLFRCADAAAGLGSPYFHHTLVLPLSLPENVPEYGEILSSIVDSAERVANYCESLGLICLYEPQGMYFNGIGLEIFFDEIQKRCNNIGICGDVGNSLFVDYAPERVFDRFAAQVLHVHLKDYEILSAPIQDKKGYKTRGGKWLYDTALGDGGVDLPYCLQRLKDARYSGAYSFEVTGDDETMRRSIEYAKRLLNV